MSLLYDLRQRQVLHDPVGRLGGKVGVLVSSLTCLMCACNSITCTSAAATNMRRACCQPSSVMIRLSTTSSAQRWSTPRRPSQNKAASSCFSSQTASFHISVCHVTDVKRATQQKDKSSVVLVPGFLMFVSVVFPGSP